eukprot:scaffold79376_cov70-Phaeocystis_antarctica.AAC.3
MRHGFVWIHGALPPPLCLMHVSVSGLSLRLRAAHPCYGATFSWLRTCDNDSQLMAAQRSTGTNTGASRRSDEVSAIARRTNISSSSSPRKSSDSAGGRSEATRGLCACWLRARARASPRTARPPRRGRLGGGAAAARACSRGGALVQRGSRSVRPPRVSCERWCRRAFSSSRRRCASALARWRTAAASRSRAACASSSRSAAS